MLSTRFSNDRGFLVQSRRGLGGSITITRVMEPVRKQVLIPLEQSPQRNEDEPAITIGHIDQVLFQHMKEARITKREAAMLHEAFVRILQDVPVERRKEAAERFYQAIMNIIHEEV